MASEAKARGVPKFVRRSAAMRRALQTADAIGPGDRGIVILGEPGSGRSRMARHLHATSQRASGPFKIMDCSQLSGTDVESSIVVADRGTLVLTNTEQISLDTSTAIEVALEYRTPSGSSHGWPSGVRLFVIADASNATPVGYFAQGLLDYGVSDAIAVPPLCERQHDLPDLVEAFLEELCDGRNLEGHRVSSQVLDAFEAYPWPTNVRELREVLRRALAVAGSDRIEVADLPRDVRASAEAYRACDESLADAERRHIIASLQRHGWRRAATARVLGISERTLRRRLEEYGLARHRR